MDIIMTGFAGASGARALAASNRSSLQRELPSSIISGALRELPSFDIPDGADVRGRVKLKEGGVFRALWILSLKIQSGFEVDVRRIPVLQEMVEVCGILDTDIYSLPCGGGWLAATARTKDFLALCSWHKVPASVIGKTTRSLERAVRLGESVRYLEGP